jgi:myo-inositol-1(or 4)-monophosphatase
VTEESRGIEELSQFAMDTVKKAGEEALAFYGKGISRLKFDETLVTEADIHLNEFFKERLFDRFPDHQVFNNSQGEREYTHEGKRYVWVYDPLDGIANFQAGIPIWGISLGLMENYWPILGIFHMPATGDFFHAKAGRKAYWGDQEIAVSSQTEINDESLLLTYSRFHRHYRTNFPGKIRNLGCAGAHLCYVAMGRAEAAIITNLSYQDLGAARVIIESAGGRIFKMDGTEFFPNEYLDGPRISDRLLAVGPGRFADVREYLEEIA